MFIPDPKKGGKCVLSFFVATKQKKTEKNLCKFSKNFSTFYSKTSYNSATHDPSILRLVELGR
jgi:hypothetical protein